MPKIEVTQNCLAIETRQLSFEVPDDFDLTDYSAVALFILDKHVGENVDWHAIRHDERIVDLRIIPMTDDA